VIFFALSFFEYVFKNKTQVLSYYKKTIARRLDQDLVRKTYD